MRGRDFKDTVRKMYQAESTYDSAEDLINHCYMAVYHLGDKYPALGKKRLLETIEAADSGTLWRDGIFEKIWTISGDFGSLPTFLWDSIRALTYNGLRRHGERKAQEQRDLAGRDPKNGWLRLELARNYETEGLYHSGPVVVAA